MTHVRIPLGDRYAVVPNHQAAIEAAYWHIQREGEAMLAGADRDTRLRLDQEARRDVEGRGPGGAA